MTEGVSARETSACSDCGTQFAEGDFVARFVCPSCGHPQAAPRGMSKDESYFHALGVPERFAQDRKELEQRFFRISHALHPDRFRASGDASLIERSLARMAFLNEAYRTLTRPEELRAYVLERAGFGEKSKKLPPPAALAEEWFELQEAVMDDPSEAAAKVAQFEARLSQGEADAMVAIAALEARADAAWSDGRQAPLAELHAKGHELSYLRSLRRDVARLKGKFSPGGGSNA